MAETAVAFLTENVSQLLKYHASLISGAEDELCQLKNDLDLLKAFLKVKSKEEEPLKRQIKEDVYEVEDTIDACLTEAAEARTKNYLSKHLGRRHIILAKVVRSLRESKLKPLMERVGDRISTSLASDAPTTNVEEHRNTEKKHHAVIRQDKVVGLKDEEETIIGYLTEQKNEELDVISVIGMRGLGKTTLAWKIFQDAKILYEFPTRIWIHVSQKLNTRDMFLNILKRFTSQDMSSLGDGELIETVRACLEREKFLLVLDDVCSLHDWKAIQDILPNRNGKSKVLITSCDNEVGKHADMKPHELRFLTREESWELLRLEVFGNVEGCPPELEGIGRVIAGKCGGLPLQIVAVGGILVDLVFMKSRDLGAIEKEWQKVCENVNLFLRGTKSISDAVELTYSRLPYDLRDCFLYMGVFPEDYEISAWTLIRLWIAEGFIQPEVGKTLEEAATQNLDDLIRRNLLIVDKINPIGEVKTCRVHDMIRGFCMEKAREQNLFQEIKMSQEGVLEPPVSELQKFRRLCVHSNVNTLLSQVPKSPGVRSFLYFSRSLDDLDPRYLSTILDAFNLLRVFVSNSIKFHQMPRWNTKLFHLRYITLSVDDLNILPEALSKLWNLQTLVVETKSPCITMKANIWSLIQLRHLKTNAVIVLSSKEKGVAGEKLQTLDTLSPESCTAEVSERAPNLKKLGIRGNIATLFENCRFLGKFDLLEKLKLVNDSKNPLRGLPPPNSFPRNLKRLTLSNTFLEWKHMRTLAMINTLEVLKLKDNAFVGIYWNAEEDCFRSLHFLLIANTDLVIWQASTKSLPSLRCLVLKDCRNLKELPVALEKLERLDMERVPISAVMSAKKIEAEKADSRLSFKISFGPGC